jgi:hypothetical protein
MRAAAVLVVVGLALGACGSSDDDGRAAGPTTTAAPATTTTTAPKTCAPFGATDEVTGPAAITRTPAVALLRNVQVQASGCVDEVAFLFAGGIPAWTVGYRDGPFTEDPSDRPVPVSGSAFLHVAMQGASGVDLAGDQPIENYDGPTTLTPAAPSGVVEIQRLGDFEAVSTWVAGLGGRRPFEVVVRGDQLVLRVAAPTPRTTACRLDATGPTIAYPADWYAELSDRWACRYFDPKPFPVFPATNASDWSVTAELADADAATVLGRMAGGDSQIARTETKVAGHDATILDVVANGAGMLPAGWGYRMYVVDFGPRALQLSGSPAAPGPGIADHAAAVDRMAALVTR